MSEEIQTQYDKVLKFLKHLPKGMSMDIFPSRTLPFFDKRSGVTHHLMLIDQGLLVSKELYKYMTEQDVN